MMSTQQVIKQFYKIAQCTIMIDDCDKKVNILKKNCFINKNTINQTIILDIQVKIKLT